MNESDSQISPNEAVNEDNSKNESINSVKPTIQSLQAVFNPNFSQYIISYLTNNNPLQRNILFIIVKTTIENMLQNNVVKPLILYYAITTINMIKALNKVELTSVMPEIKKMISIIYPNDEEYVNKVVAQILVLSLLLNGQVQKNENLAELLNNLIIEGNFL
jgi:hypothetical protein